MTSFEDLLSQAIVQRLGWTLLHFVWQGAAVAALLAAGLWFLRRRSANARYVVCGSALLLMAALPMATFWTVVSVEGVDARASVSRGSVPSGFEQNSRPTSESSVGTAADSLPPTLSDDGAASVPLSGTARAPTRAAPFPSEIGRLVSTLEPLLPWFVAIWATGVLILSLRLFGGWVQLQFLKRRAVEPVADRLQQAAVRLSKHLRLRRVGRLLESAVVQVPMVIGWLRPVILLPASAVTRLPMDQLEALLAHELAHIRRYDYLVNMIQTVIETLLFYHPAVWWVSRRIRAEREHCCDDLAVSVCGDSLLYARALIELEQVRGAEPALAVAADTGDLLARVRRITGRPLSRTRCPRPGLAGAVAILAVVAAITGVFSHARQQVPNAPPKALNIDAGEIEARVVDAANDEEAAVLCERLLGDFERAKSHLLRRWEQVQNARVSHARWIVAVRLARCSAHLGDFEDADIWLERSAEIDPTRRHRPIEEEIALCRKWVPIRENHRKAYAADPSLADARELFRAHEQLAEYARMRQLAMEMHSRFGQDPWLASQEFQSACQFLASYFAPPNAPEVEEPKTVPARNPQVEALFEKLRENRRNLVQFTKAKWERVTTVEKARALIGVSQQPQAFYQKQGQKEPRELTEKEAIAILTSRGFTAKGRARNANAARRFNEQIQHIVTKEERAPFEAEEVAFIDELARMGEVALDDLFRKLDGSFDGLWAQKTLARMADEAIPALTREIETMCDLASRERLQHEHRVRMSRLVRALASQQSPTAIPGLRLALDYPDIQICREALGALARIPEGLAQDILLRLWEHENIDVRGSAASLLGERGDDKAIKVFQRDIPTAYGEARYEAEHAIWRIRGRLGLERGEEPEQVRQKKGDDPRVWEGIDKSINSPNRGIRFTVINRLDYGTPRPDSLKPLMGLIETDPDNGVRLRATQVYARIFGRSVNEAAARGKDVAQFSAGFDALADKIDKGDEETVSAALAAARVFRHFESRPGYDAIEKRVLEGLGSQSIALRSTCMSAFVGLFSRDGERLERVLSPARRQAAERAVLSGLSSDYGRYWVDATAGAQMLGFTEATPALVRMVQSGDWYRRWTAAVALGEIGDARAIAPLEQMAYTDPYVDHNGLYANRETAWQAAQAIRQRTGRPLPRSTSATGAGGGSGASRDTSVRSREGTPASVADTPVADTPVADNRTVDGQVESWLSEIKELESEHEQRKKAKLSAMPEEELAIMIDTNMAVFSGLEAELRTLVQETSKRIATLGEAAVPALIEKLDEGSQGKSYYPDCITRSLTLIGAPSVPHLISLLRTGNRFQKRAAASVLGSLGDQRAVAPLVASLDDEDSLVRSWLASALGGLKAQEAVGPLLAKLRDHETTMQHAVVQALGQIGDVEAVPALIHGIKEHGDRQNELDGAFRYYAYVALGRIGDETAIPILEEGLKDDGKSPLKGQGDNARAAAEALERIRLSASQRKHVDKLREGTRAERMEAARALAIREKEPVLALIQALKHERDEAVKVEIVTALGKAVKDTNSKHQRTVKLDVQQEVFNALLDAMREEVPQVTLVAIEAIRGMNPNWIGLFAHPERLHEELALQLGSKQLVLMKSKETALQLRRATIELLADRWDVLTRRRKDAFLAEHGGHVKARVSAGLHVDDPATRAAAARLLSDLGDTNCIPRLIELLRARKSVGVMASSLARLRADAAVPDLIEIGKRSQEPQAKFAIVKALGQIGDRRALDFLIAATQEGQPASRAEALRALMRIKDARALDAVIATAQDGPVTLRIEAVHALTTSADERATSVLADVFKEAVNSSVRGHRILHFTDEDQRHRFVRSIATTLASRGTPEAMEALAQGLQYPRPQVRAHIVYITKSSPSPRVPDILMDTLNTEKHDLVRRDIIVVLGQLRSREALPTLEAALAAEEERWNGRKKVRPRDEHDAKRFLWAASAYDRSYDRNAVVKRDLSELPGPGNNLALPDPYAASADYYLGDVIRQAIAQIEGRTHPQTSALRDIPPCWSAYRQHGARDRPFRIITGWTTRRIAT